jgi:hypothetical protein
MKIEGGCFCGAVRYEIGKPTSRITHCHCLHCRGTSGAPYLTWAEFDAAQFRIVTGTPGRFESRPLVIRQFCTVCGTQLTYQHAEEPDIIDVTVCSLDEPAGFQPEDHIWTDRMLPWVQPADGLPRYQRSRLDDDTTES